MNGTLGTGTKFSQNTERKFNGKRQRRTRDLRDKGRKKESWALYTLCKNFLEENSTLWKILKDKQIKNRESNDEDQRGQNEK